MMSWFETFVILISIINIDHGCDVGFLSFSTYVLIYMCYHFGYHGYKYIEIEGCLYKWPDVVNYTVCL